MIGRISTLWAAFENDIDQLIAELINVEAAAGACLTAQMIGPGPRFRAVIALIRFRGLDRSEISKWNALSTQVSASGSKRNRYINSSIGIATESGIIRSAEITADKKLKFDFFDFDLTKTHQLWIDIKQAQNSLGKIRMSLTTLITWSTDQFEQSDYGIRRSWNHEEVVCSDLPDGDG